MIKKSENLRTSAGNMPSCCGGLGFVSCSW